MAPIRDWDRLRYPIALLIKGLTSSQSDSETQAVRQAITHAVLSGQTWDTVDPFSIVAQGSGDTSPQAIERSRGVLVTDDDLRLADSLRPADDSAVIAQRVVLRPAGVHESAQQQFVRYEYGIGLVPASVLGPLSDLLGRRLELAVFRPSRPVFTALRSGFFINTTVTPTDQAFVSAFGPCTLWVPATAYATAAPANSYFGLRVKAGKVINPPVQWSQVEVELAPQAPWDGPLAARFSRSLPATLQFTIGTLAQPVRGNLRATGAGKVAAFGDTVNLQYAGGIAEYDASTRRLAFPLTADITSLQLGDVDTDLVHFSGTAQLVKAAWSLPVTVFPTTDQFSPVAGNGAISLALAPGLRSRFLDDQDIWTYGNIEVAVDETTASISGGTAWTSATRALDFWLHGNPRDGGISAQTRRSTVTLRSKSTLANPLKRGFPFKYVIQAGGQESWSYSAAVTAALGSPVTVDGTRTPFTGIASLFFTRTKPGFLPFASIESRRTAPRRNSRTSYLLDNMLISATDIDLVLAYGEYSWGDHSVVTGHISLPTTLVNAMPILPDPYVTNIQPKFPEPIGAMVFHLGFDGRQEVRADVQLPSGSLGRLQPLPGSAFDNDANPDTRFKLPAEQLWDKISKNQVEHSERYTSLGPFLATEPAFLDISSNVSHMGIVLSDPDGPFVVNGMTASITANNMKVFSLPSVQWEALYMTEPAPGHRIDYPTAGIGTKMTTDSVNLVPVTPRHLLDEVVSAYNPADGTALDSKPVSLNFQLPFGMLAKATVAKQRRPRPSKTIKLGQPIFEKEVYPQVGQATPTDNKSTKVKYTGGAQVSFRSRPGDEARGFAGTALLPDPTLSPLPGFITSQFNQDFASVVPLTGFDISGYGASMFSTWQPAEAPLVGISKVALDVVVGRAAREVVQMSSVLYPYGVRVIRTVTILRLNSGRVEGRDSGWLAASDGYYDFGEPVTPQDKLQVHLGLVRGVKQVTNIKPIDGSDNLVNFDCYMDIEGTENGTLIPAQGQRGYIVTRSGNPNDRPKSLASAAYADILRQNQLGGPVDAVVKLGNSEQRLRVSRVLVGTCENRSTPSRTSEFPMELWGTPVVPGGGQWAFTRKIDKEFGKKVQEAVDSWGVPLVRKGVDAASSLASAIRVADAIDVLEDGVSKYSLIHSADSHRLMFPAPQLIPGAAGEVVKGLTSDVPVLADGFALATTATGSIFPELETCIPLNNANRVLQVLGGGHYEYKLLEQGGSLALDELERHIRQDGSFSSIVSSAGKLLPDNITREKAYIDMAISTVTGAKDMSLKNISMITQGAAKKELSRVVGSVLSSAQSLPIVKEAEHFFGDALSQVQKVVDYLNKLKVLPPLKVSMTNEWALEVSTSMGLDEFLERLGAGASAEAIKKIIQVLNFAMKGRTTPTSAIFTMSVDIAVNIPTGLGPSVLGVGGFKVRAGTSGNLVEMTLGAGIGVEMQVGPFGASAYYSQSQSVIISKDIYGVAATCVLKVHVNLVVATADLLLEARLGLIGGPCTASDHATAHGGDTIFAYAQVHIALHVSIFLVINCTVDESAEWKNKMNSGGCDIHDMLPMP